MRIATGINQVEYSVLAGPAFTVFFVISMLFTGMLTDRLNRKVMLSVAIIGWSISTGLHCFANSFGTLLAARLGVGLFQSAATPPAFSLMDDYFPIERRTTDNSIYVFGYGLGSGMSIITPVVIGAIGWRLAFVAIGSLGVFIGLVCLFTIKEPERFRFYRGKSIKFVGNSAYLSDKPLFK